MNQNGVSSQRPSLVAYGSETGTALDYAEELGRALERLHFMTSVCSLDSVDLASYSEPKHLKMSR